jgi:hypothetical protein
MAMQERRLQVDQVAKSRGDLVDARACNEASRLRFGVDHGRAQVGVVQLSQQCGSLTPEHRCEVWVERPAGALLNGVGCASGPPSWWKRPARAATCAMRMARPISSPGQLAPALAVPLLEGLIEREHHAV